MGLGSCSTDRAYVHRQCAEGWRAWPARSQEVLFESCRTVMSHSTLGASQPAEVADMRQPSERVEELGLSDDELAF